MHGGDAWRRRRSIEHQHAQRDVTQQGAGVGGLERALPAVRLELSDVVKQRAREHEIAIGPARGGDGTPDGRHLAGVTEQATELGMVSGGAGGTRLEASAEALVLIEQIERAPKPRSRDRPRATDPAPASRV